MSVSDSDWCDEDGQYWGPTNAEEARDMNREKEEEWVTIPDVKFLNRTDRAVLVKFPGAGQRWVPISQTPDDFDPEIPSEGDLVVTEWFSNKLEEEGEEEEEDVTLPNTVVLRESDKAIQVRLADGATHWIPKTQIRETSEVQNDGDRGKLVVSAWIAEQKDLLGEEPKEMPNITDRVSKKKGWGDNPPPSDDDIPF